ncbi:hypothetical protein BC97_0210395 [Escherichia coli]|nr:hypothetical protein BC97_0210395 [Escherichia coli]KFF51977.1 hypothetical protein BC99_0312055 [Escherichia coli]
MLRHSNRGFACEQGWNAAGQLTSQRAGFFPEETTWGGLLPQGKIIKSSLFALNNSHFMFKN